MVGLLVKKELAYLYARSIATASINSLFVIYCNYFLVVYLVLQAYIDKLFTTATLLTLTAVLSNVNICLQNFRLLFKSQYVSKQDTVWAA